MSGERTLEAFYESVQPFAAPFMAQIAARTPSSPLDPEPLSRCCSRQATVEALRTVFLEDLVARPLEKEERTGGLWDRQGNRLYRLRRGWHTASGRQRALPSTPDLPPAQRRLDEVCAPGYLGRKRGETVRTRTTVRKNHTHQWVGTFSGATASIEENCGRR
jgi:hypothetical protein